MTVILLLNLFFLLVAVDAGLPPGQIPRLLFYLRWLKERGLTQGRAFGVVKFEIYA